jgi:hypothetical protein
MVKKVSVPLERKFKIKKTKIMENGIAGSWA